jgi:hypothetical protein
MQEKEDIAKENLLNAFDLPDIIGISLGVIGAIGVLFAIYTWYKSKNKEKLYSQIFQAASDKLNIEKTSAELNEKETELSSLNDELNLIKKSIPIEAQKAVLLDKIDSVTEQLNRNYQEALNLNNDLELIESQDLEKIPDKLLNDVKRFIQPKYLLRERIDNQKTLLTILTTIASICLLLIPDFGRIIGTLIFILAIPLIIALTRNYIKLQETKDKRSKIRISLWFLILGITISVPLWLTTMYIIVNPFRGMTEFGEGITFTGFFIGLGLIPFLIFKTFKKLIEN